MLLSIRRFLLAFVFFVIPLMYVGLYLPGVPGTLGYIVDWLFPSLTLTGFESFKVQTFIFFMAIILVLHFCLPLSRESLYRWSIFLAVLTLWTLGSFGLNHDLPSYLSGTFEKRHGWLYVVSLGVLTMILRDVSHKERKLCFRMVLWSSFFVCLYAFFQFFGLDPLSSSYQTRLDTSRLFSTLGNPNYLAGYLLIIFPFLGDQREKNIERSSLPLDMPLGISPEKNDGLTKMNHDEGQMTNDGFIWLIFGVLIYWTGSYLSCILFGSYGVYVFLLQKAESRRYASEAYQVQKVERWIIILFLALIGIIVLWNTYGQQLFEVQKFKGFIARWYLWQTGISAIFSDWKHVLFGFGPDGFLFVSEQFRHPMLSVYEDSAYRIDSSHNIFIDTALSLGVPLTMYFCYIVFTRLSRIPPHLRSSVILFLVYFSFNIPVVSHLILIILFLSWRDDADFC